MGSYFSNDNMSASESSESKEKTCDKIEHSSRFISNHTLSVTKKYVREVPITCGNDDKHHTINKSCALPRVENLSLKHSSMFCISPNEIAEPTLQSNDDSQEIVDVSKLLVQLLNAKVVLEKLDEHLVKSSHVYPVARAVNVDTKDDLDDEKELTGPTIFNDYFQLYCATCKELKFSFINNCSECATPLSYLCTKCNVKCYEGYSLLMYHWNQCNGVQLSKKPKDTNVSTDRTNIYDKNNSADKVLILDKSQFIVKQNQIENMLTKTDRSCSEKYSTRSSAKNDKKIYCQLDTKYRCTHCEYATFCWSTMNKHFKNQHTELLFIKCELCPYESKYKNNLRIHMNKVHGKISKKFYCKSCSFSTWFESNFERHTRLKH